MSDRVLELWLRFLALHIKDPATPGTAAPTIRDGWLLASRGFFTGCVPDGLEEAMGMRDGEAVVRDAINSLEAALNRAAPEIDKATLNLMGFDGDFTKNVETRRLLEVAEAFTALLDGKITSDASDTSFMPGCR